MKTFCCRYKNSNACSWRFGLALCAALLMAAAVGMAAPGTAQAAHTTVLTVTNGSDSGPNSLRAAITTANNNPKTPYKIVFAPDLGGSTITLASTLPAIESTLTIDGGGTIAISGNNAYQVMSVAAGATLELDNLTIEHGYPGGVFLDNDATLTVANSTFSDNSGHGGIVLTQTDSTVTVTNSTFSDNSSGYAGGAIDNVGRGTLTVTNSTFSGNTAQYGGGIRNFGTLTVRNSTFSGNTAGSGGGGIDNSAGTVTVDKSTFSGNTAARAGGGILNFAGTVTVTNSTFSGNTAIASNGGGIYNDNDARLTVTNSTFSGNAADIYNDSGGKATLEGTILAGSLSGADCRGQVTDNGYNIDDDRSCGFTKTTSRSGYGGTLFRGGLADNGGPTETIALAPGASNPAIDKIPARLCPSTDQRGYARLDDHEHFCDVGAYESGAISGERRATLVCQQSKLRAQGELIHCLGLNSVDVLKGGPDQSAECRNRFTDELKRIDEVAAKEGTSCRYIDNGNGTVSDLNTGLMWEKTVGTVGGANTGAINDVNNAYTWPAAWTHFLAGLNGVSNDYEPKRIRDCFANHCDWRLPSILELKGIVDLSATGCGSGSACIDPIFGPTQNGFYWSGTNLANDSSYAFAVNFFGSLLFYTKTGKFYVRAVRGGL